MDIECPMVCVCVCVLCVCLCYVFVCVCFLYFYTRNGVYVLRYKFTVCEQV